MEILKQAPKFKPIMSIMLVNSTTAEIVKNAYLAGAKALKLIPENTSINSTDGVSLIDLEKFYPVLKTAQELGMIFSGHWELNRHPLKEFIPELKREVAAISYLEKLIHDIPGLKIVVEHISTKEMIEFIKRAPKNVAATLTAHHAVLTIDDVMDKNGKIVNPYNYCKPVPKSDNDRKAVIEAMTSGNPKFFFGSDSAPHLIVKKESLKPPPGIFSAPVALPLLCQIFKTNKALDKLEKFASEFGAKFYGLELNKEKIEITRREWIVPSQHADIRIFMGGEKLSWSVV
ncbi:MAG: hypothetical protein A3A94_01945 [Candidatus Portnoybacteria bacterium RIFCSPLOWO2_01_FULL_43_11]|nr:MAG: hypothetical protein A3D38_01070 [Candidatus Portnoybacteria bacterium RIFCSPHIGHO2_02_FULL_40_23]OGZ39065.1 MAG: hypothetical protein A3A94_01945 [Candidatus Portnoybacteria bacterium RIFCSPLOWO2_01_FULL_43_11]OGZ39342.1 MAG: hypothetical protein A3E90_01270 [Candidatus Portnoybacteria bacterium RIFCSPHIGHO2_12_FULL_40_11]